MKRPSGVGLLLLPLFLLTLSAGCSPDFQGGCQSASAPFAGLKKDQTAPDFTLPLATNTNKSFTLSELVKEKPVLLIFWATWCPACVDEIPTLNQWAKSYSPENLQILAVNLQESPMDVAEFFKNNPVSYPSVIDETGHVAEQYGLVGVPSSVLLAKGGEIIYYGFGLPSNLDEWLTKASAR